MFKRITIILGWFAVAPVAFLFLTVLLFQSKHIDYLAKVGPVLTADAQIPSSQLEGNVLGVQVSDMRPFYVESFLKGTKLKPYSHLMVETADKYGLDYRLIPAIAMKESGGGNAVSEDSHNAWGFENGRTSWDSWEVAIEQVGKTLKTRYVDRGMTTPDEMMAVYAPPQLLTGGKWAIDINHFYKKLEGF